MAFDLTGLWQADDGGTYVIRQIDDIVWWLGLSKGGGLHPALDSTDGVFYPGLQFCNVYRGQMIEQLVYGQWSDVPRGATANHGDLTLVYVDGLPDEQQLLKDFASGGFGGSTWRRVSAGPVERSAAELFRITHKNVQVFLGNQETLADNLQLIRDAASVFGVIKSWGTPEQRLNAVSIGYTANRGIDYRSFICGGDDDGDGDITFHLLVDRDQIQGRQPGFFVGINPLTQSEAEAKMLSPLEGEIIMYGRSPDCDHSGADTPPLFPGWAESGGSAVLFDGEPIPVVLLPTGVDSNQRNFLSALHFEDPVRVTGALVLDIGHPPDRLLEIHPVYSVDSIISSLSDDLSGTWADDFGNTYYVRHDVNDNTLWYAGLSPLASQAYGQVFFGTFDPGASTATGNIVALSFGFEAWAPPLGFSPTPLGDTGQVVFELGSTMLLNVEVTTMTVGNFRLMRLQDFPQVNVEQI
jgi:hypothetical protein